MNPQVKAIIDDLATVATKSELLSMVERTEDREAINYAVSLDTLPENSVRRATFLDILGIKASDATTESPAQSATERFTDLYRKEFNVSPPEYLVELVDRYNLDSPILLNAIGDAGDFNHLARLQTLQFKIRGKSFVKDYRTFRSKDNISGKPNYFGFNANAGSSSKKSPTNNTFLLADVLVRYPKNRQILDVVALATADEFWSSKKPSEIVMSKLYAVGAMQGPVTIETIEKMITSLGANPKEVAEQVRWTLDGGYSKYGWIADHIPESSSIHFRPVGPEGWDGFDRPEGYLSYSEFKSKKKK